MADGVFNIAKGKAELGLGIHGEPGFQQIDFTGAEQAMAAMIGKLAGQAGDASYVALLNNLGGASALEMSVLAYELLRSYLGRRIKYIVGPAPMMTSLDMRGVSVSILPLTPEDEDGLLGKVSLPAWPGCQPVTEPLILALPDGLTPLRPPASDRKSVV